MRSANRGRTRARGFSLVELMVVVAITTILLSIAIPSYRAHVLKSHRTEAKTAVLDLAGREEQLFSLTNTYSQMPADLGYTGAQFPVTAGNGYYEVDVKVTAAGMNPATFTITATAVDDQLNDSQCKTFAVDNLGRQMATDSADADAPDCWK